MTYLEQRREEQVLLQQTIDAWEAWDADNTVWVQWLDVDNVNLWTKADPPTWEDETAYRLSPTPKTRDLKREEWEQVRMVKGKLSGTSFTILGIKETGLHLDGSWRNWDCVLLNYTHLDGSPLTVEVQ